MHFSEFYWNPPGSGFFYFAAILFVRLTLLSSSNRAVKVFSAPEIND
ncbi:hypothetical protein HMPREF9413_0867 [Paenibacillus sp. HGF7]|nr:hypothetical protein HMPREF9413_0867 [Paenibacillus sp. HGF7]